MLADREPAWLGQARTLRASGCPDAGWDGTAKSTGRAVPLQFFMAGKTKVDPISVAAGKLVSAINAGNTAAARTDPAFVKVVVDAAQRVNDCASGVLSGLSPKVYRQWNRPPVAEIYDADADSEEVDDAGE